MSEWVAAADIPEFASRRHLIIGPPPSVTLARRARASIVEILAACDVTSLRPPSTGVDEMVDRAAALKPELWRWETVLCCGAQVCAMMGARLNRMERPFLHTSMWGVLTPMPGQIPRQLADHEHALGAWWSVVRGGNVL